MIKRSELILTDVFICMSGINKSESMQTCSERAEQQNAKTACINIE